MLPLFGFEAFLRLDVSNFELSGYWVMVSKPSRPLSHKVALGAIYWYHFVYSFLGEPTGAPTSSHKGHKGCHKGRMRRKSLSQRRQNEVHKWRQICAEHYPNSMPRKCYLFVRYGIQYLRKTSSRVHGSTIFIIGCFVQYCHTCGKSSGK